VNLKYLNKVLIKKTYFFCVELIRSDYSKIIFDQCTISSKPRASKNAVWYGSVLSIHILIFARAARVEDEWRMSKIRHRVTEMERRVEILVFYEDK
jgi:hypothetical protein